LSEVNPPGFLQNAGNVHTAEITRNAIGPLLHGNNAASSLVGRGGVVFGPGGSLTVSQNGSPNMSVNVNSGFIYIPGTEGSKQGLYSCLNDASKNVTIAAADGSNPRIDLIVCKVQDTVYSGATNSWSIVAVTGTPAGSPVAPTAPANSITLARIAVGAGVTSIVTANITDVRFYAAALGGRIRCTSTTRPSSTVVPDGTEIFETDTNLVRNLIGSTWLLASPYRQVNTLGSAASSITISSIPSTLRRLQVSWYARGDAALASIAVSIRVNADGGGNYASAFTQITTQVSDIAQTSMKVGNCPANTAAASQFASGEIAIAGWNSRSKLNPTFQYTASDPGSAPTAFYGYGGGLYNSAGPYTSLTLLPGSGNFITGSEFMVFGWE
jgi:hypothetical protein